MKKKQSSLVELQALWKKLEETEAGKKILKLLHEAHLITIRGVGWKVIVAALLFLAIEAVSLYYSSTGIVKTTMSATLTTALLWAVRLGIGIPAVIFIGRWTDTVADHFERINMLSRAFFDKYKECMALIYQNEAEREIILQITTYNDAGEVVKEETLTQHELEPVMVS